MGGQRRHGTRAKYVAEKCRCEPCREANTTYARERDRNQRRAAYGIEELTPAYVDSTEARQHLHWLSKVGVGKRRVAEITGLAETTIWKIRTQRVDRCRKSTANKILAVGRSKAADHAYVDAKDTWRRIDDLLAHGWTKASIARAIGCQTPALQLSRSQVTAKQARQIQRLHEIGLRAVIEDRQIAAERRARYRQPRRDAA